jgi:putative membrane protein insertion efficiency factor
MSTGVTRLLIAFVRGYRLLLSPWLGNACRFEPTCSAYALDALAEHGAWAGTVLTVCRIGRCHPWCEGGFDPVPAGPPRWLSSLVARSEARTASLSSDVSDATSS